MLSDLSRGNSNKDGFCLEGLNMRNFEPVLLIQKTWQTQNFELFKITKLFVYCQQ